MLNSILKIVEIIVPVISLIVAFFLLRESRKMHVLSSSPNLVFSFHSLSSNRIIGRLENIGYGIAYNIKVDLEPDFKIMRSTSLYKLFENVSYLAPKQFYDVDYGFVNINHKLIDFKPHKLIISWSKKKNDKKRYYFVTCFKESYFDSFPTSYSFNDLVKEIRDLNRNLKSKKI